MASIAEWRARLRRDLRSVSGDFAAIDTDSILAEVLNANPTQLTLRSAEDVTVADADRIQTLVTKRAAGIPLAYVLGHVEFYGLDLLCDERVLIPRPETEEVVDVALKSLPRFETGRNPLAIDVGTGSGNIALAIAHNRPDVRIIAADLSADALTVARINRDRHNLTDQVRLVRAKSLTAFPQSLDVDLIVSNPPYVPNDDPEVQRSVHDYEPHVALYGGSDGTEILRDLIANSRTVLRHGGCLVCEIGYNQAIQIREIVSHFPDWRDPVFHRSIAGFDRVLELRLR